MEGNRDLDIVVFGATGFVGKLTAEYLARHAPDGVRVGLAGRSEEKLARVKSELGTDWPTIVADSSDAASLKALAERCRVMATTVGPYRKYGMPLVEACAAAGTDYIDLTGEPLFIRDSIDRCHAEARQTGARIVHCCGFDSIPSDLGVWLLHEEAGELAETTLVVKGVRGGASGGTVDSMTTMIDEIKSDSAKRKLLLDPYSLSPDRDAEPDLGRQLDFGPPTHDDDIGQWLAPFVMGAINTRTVRRSNALQEWAYGRGFRYRETMATGSGPVGLAKATALVGGLSAMTGALAVPPVRSALGRFIPSAGEGPSAEAREKGFFKIEIHARTPAGERYVCRIEAQGDPGYAATAVMFGEAALCLVLDRDRLPEGAGVLTPATAMDGALLDRLRAAGQTYEVARA
jgi:short subunit dehydrogenase-like uncharacterized protein